MESLDDLKAQRNRLKSELASVNEKIDGVLAATVVRCPNKSCLRGYEVRELEYIQTHWYETPSGCMDGDQWHAGEGQWQCHACGTVTRLYNKPDITRLKCYFKCVIDTYGS